ncbi:SIS domain-containing protein [Dictyobacter formicarum]|uniref:Glucosamine--fructose-6-phosphate aminotransferase n=1 Tax=Dictyobacter formicarum TaxID=2778368 RepID=A0ABQ3VCB3_9CHLR|nr:SIS domain-containing protein [Dictyobacter formicarum]GHO83542.1 glucosamine--fructose-6-phosphate aminotransferase [Dictyobacter formicarum]
MSSLLEQEIHSQPEVIARLLDKETRHIQQIVAQLPGFDYILIAARGSSDHAATYAKYAWATMARYPIALAAPSLQTLYDAPPRMNNALVVGISQSGQSPDIVAVLEEGKRQGRPTIAITNDSNSALAKAADHVVELHAGQERSVAATKTYTAQLAVMMLFAASWSGDQQRLAELQQVPDAIASILQNAAEIAQRTERYRYMNQCVVVGRGYNYATSFELALKLKELTYVMATAYSSADFRHGPIATIEEGLPTILAMPGGAAFADMIELAKDLQQRQAELLIISDTEEALKLAQTPFAIPTGIPEWLSPITAIIPGQLFGLHLTLTKRLQPDTPRGLNKITLTR